MTRLDPRTPVLVGVGEATHRGPEPIGAVDLAGDASTLALLDAGGTMRDRIDTLVVINILSPAPADPAHRLGRLLGLTPARHLSTTIGGNTPQWLVGRFGDEILARTCDAVLVAGAEAGASARRVAGPPDSAAVAGTDEVIGDDRIGVGPLEIAAGLMAPPRLYPLFESAIAARAGRSLDEQRTHLGGFMAPATRVAAGHPDTAWFPVERTPAELAEPTLENRMISEPYTKWMNAIISVDQSAAYILCAAEVAEAAGVPTDRWVFPRSTADLNDVFFPSQRPELDRSPAIAGAARAALDAAGCGADDIAHLDVYSCFPCAVEMTAQALGLALDDHRGFTVTGGHAYFGGPGNNYTTHAIAEVVHRCRAEPGSLALTTGLGWYVTKHAVGIWSTMPPDDGFAHPDLRAEQASIDQRALPLRTPDQRERATVDAFTVFHDRTAGPVSVPIVATLADGARTIARSDDADLARELSGGRLIGAAVEIVPEADGALGFVPV